MSRSNAAPIPGEQACRRFVSHILDILVRHAIRRFGRVHGVRVLSIAQPGWRVARNDRRARGAMAEGDEFALLVEGRGKFIAKIGAIGVMLNIFFPAENHLQRKVDLLGEMRGRLHVVGVEPATKATADEVVVHCHLLRCHSNGFRDQRLNSRGGL